MVYRSILCLNGICPPKAFFEQWDLPIIAADGAANTLCAMGVIPWAVVGDMDSVTHDLGCVDKVIPVYDQDFSDYEKALRYAEKENLLPSIIVGFHGGDLDHITHNIHIFSGSVGHLLFAPPLYGMALKEGKHSFALPLGTKLSLMGIPYGQVTSQGLKWPLKKKILSFSECFSFANRTDKEKVRLDICTGKILILMHAFPYCDFPVFK